MSIEVAIVVNGGKVQTAWVIDREDIEDMAAIGGFAIDAYNLDYLEFHVTKEPVMLGMDWPPPVPTLTDMDKHILGLALIAVCAHPDDEPTDEFRENVRHVARALGVYDDKLEAVIALYDQVF